MGSLAWNIFWGIFQFQKLTFSAEAVLETSWALQSVDLPGENQIKIILCCPFKNMKPCAFSFLENTGDAPRGTPEVQNQPGEVFQSRCIWISTQQVTLTYHLELYFPLSCTCISSSQVTYHLQLRSSLEVGQINFRTCDLVDEILVRNFSVILIKMIWEPFVVWRTHCWNLLMTSISSQQD